AALPAYTLEGPYGGRETTRGDESTSRVFGPHSQIRVLLRPELRATSPVQATAWAPRRDGWEALPSPTVEISSSGAVRFEAAASAVFPSPGQHVLWLSVHPANKKLPSHLSPTDLEAQQASGQWFSVSIQYKSET